MDCKRLSLQLKEVVGDSCVLAQAPMEKHTTWRIGGPADLLVIPKTVEDLKKSLQFAQNNSLPITVVGNGSNLLVLDGGIRGLVIKLGKGIKNVSLQGDLMIAGGGVMLPVLSRRALKASLSGLEFAAGIPATVGGAIVMNAGAHGKEIGSIIQEVETVDYQGREQKWLRDELSFSYRTSSLKSKNIIVSKAVFKLSPAEENDIAKCMDQGLASRKKTQPTGLPSAGSVFRNPPHHHAGKLIEKAGLKGYVSGGAAVSDKHANFIVNCGTATARDVLELIKIIQEHVSEQMGIMLAPEILILGEER